MNPEKESAYILAGEGVVLEGPEIVKSAIGNWDAGQELVHTSFGHAVENSVDAVQGMAPIFGVLGLTLIGLKMMVEGPGNGGKKNRRTGLAS